ncbi:NADPH-dependent F420 reductase [Pseudolysinimonas sp.]|uniref:NADPH-dependent F420 reductase n=1 Tax=Pseudolysinimonas sp. TaxID=2680009 RepID=UPI003F811EA7
MNIGILGAGKAGTSIARAALAAGDAVRIASSGDPARIALIVDVLVPGAVATTAADAVRDADLVILAVPMHKFRDVDAALLAGKVVIDVMNYWEPIDGLVEELEDAPEGTSVIVQRAFPGARLVKSLNHLGYHELEEDARPSGAADRRAVAAASDDGGALAIVLDFVDRIGFEPIDAGSLAQGAALEPGSPLFGARYDRDAFEAILQSRLAQAA